MLVWAIRLFAKDWHVTIAIFIYKMISYLIEKTWYLRWKHCKLRQQLILHSHFSHVIKTSNWSCIFYGEYFHRRYQHKISKWVHISNHAFVESSNLLYSSNKTWHPDLICWIFVRSNMISHICLWQVEKVNTCLVAHFIQGFRLYGYMQTSYDHWSCICSCHVNGLWCIADF